MPQSIAQPTSGSAERVLTRAHIEFLSTQLPDERVTDGIVVSCLAIQHINLLLANTNNVFPFCCLGPGPTC